MTDDSPRGFARETAAAIVRDHIVRATGVDRDIAPGWLSLVDTALEVLASRARGGRRGRLPFTAETSLRFQPGALERRRYTIGIPSHALGAEAVTRLLRILETLRPPAQVVGFLTALRDANHLPSAILLGLAAADAGGAPTARLYFEQRSLGRVLALPIAALDPSALSAEWWPGESSVALRAYHETPATKSAIAAARDELGSLPSAVEAPIERIFGAIDAQFFYRRSDLDGGRTSAFQLVALPSPLARHREAILQLAVALDIDRALVQAALDATPDSTLRVVAVGKTRAGIAHVTLYHVATFTDEGAPARDETRAARDVRDLPHAVLLRLARVDGTLVELVLTSFTNLTDLSIGQLDAPAARVANLAVYQLGREHDLAQAVAEALAVTAHLGKTTSAAIRMAVGEPRIRAALDARGVRFLGYLVNP